MLVPTFFWSHFSDQTQQQNQLTRLASWSANVLLIYSHTHTFLVDVGLRDPTRTSQYGASATHTNIRKAHATIGIIYYFVFGLSFKSDFDLWTLKEIVLILNFSINFGFCILTLKLNVLVAELSVNYSSNLWTFSQIWFWSNT